MHVLRTAAHVTTSLDQPVDNEGSTALVELLADPQAADPLQSAIEREQRDDLSAMLRLLPQRHRRVLAGRYGLDGKSVQRHEQIGASAVACACRAEPMAHVQRGDRTRRSCGKRRREVTRRARVCRPGHCPGATCACEAQDLVEQTTKSREESS